MRIPHALALATAYALGRPQPARTPAPGAGSEPAIVEPKHPVLGTEARTTHPGSVPHLFPGDVVVIIPNLRTPSNTTAIQAARDALAPALDAPGATGEAIRFVSAILDDVLADLTTDTAEAARA